MPYPCKGKHPWFGTWNDELWRDSDKNTRIRVGTTGISPSFNQRPLEEIQKSMVLDRGPRIPESPLRSMMDGQAHLLS